MSKKRKKSHQGKQARAQQQHHREEPLRAAQSLQQATPPLPRPRNRSIEQERAAHALEKIKDFREKGDTGYYVSYVSALPATIVTNGLGQALVMLLAKAKGNRQKEHYVLYKHLASWLSRQVEGLKANNSDDEVVDKLIAGDQDLYVRAQTEAMAYLHWLKQFARAYLKEKEGQGD